MRTSASRMLVASSPRGLEPGARILVVEDDRDLASILSFVLRSHGYEVVEAADGESAFTRFRDESPDLVVTDIRLPGVDGWELCERIRARTDTPIVILTLADSQADHDRAQRLAVSAYMTKPFSPLELIERIRAALAERAQAGPGHRQAGG